MTLLNQDLLQEVTEFIYYEAELLNDNRHTEWLQLLTPDIIYQVPLRITLEKGEGNGFDSISMLMDEDIQSLTLRVFRLETEYCWAEMPSSRTRHHISNIRIKETNPNTFLVKSNVLLYRNRGDASSFDLLSAERHDIIKKVDEEFKLAKRLVYLDQSVIAAHNISFFF